MTAMQKLLEESHLQEAAVPLRNGETYQDREQIDQLLQTHWKGKGAWLRGDINHDNMQQFTYGEVTPMGVRQLIACLGLERVEDDEVQDGKDPIIFYDLGSGAGKLVVQMFLEKAVTMSIGVELSTSRHLIAIKAWESLQEESNLQRDATMCKIPQDNGQVVEKKRVQLLHKDILETDFSDATHLYLSSLCFPQDLADQVGDLVMEAFQKSGKLRGVVSLSDVKPLETDEMRALWKKSIELLYMTWGFSSAKVYKYSGPARC